MTKRNNRFYSIGMAKRHSDVNPLREAKTFLKTFEEMGRICGVTGKAASKWVEAGRLPRTEATGETNYAELLSLADPRINKQKLLSTVMQIRT